MGKVDKPDKPSKPPKQGSAKTFVVASAFRDRDDFSKQFLPGEDVSHFDPDRLEHLIKNGLVSDDQ